MEKDQKRSLIITIVAIIITLLAAILGYLLLVKESEDEKNSEDEKTIQIEEMVEDTQDSEEEKEFIPYEFTYYSSQEVLTKLNDEAKNWSSDAKLYSCDGLTLSSYAVDEHVYEYVSGEDGTYTSWICDFYSASKNSTNMIQFKRGSVEVAEEFNLGEYSAVMYKGINYPTDVTKVADSKTLFNNISDEIDTDKYYYHTRLRDVKDYGYVWRVEEVSKNEKDEYEQNKVVRTFIFDTYSGNLIKSVDGSIY